MRGAGCVWGSHMGPLHCPCVCVHVLVLVCVHVRSVCCACVSMHLKVSTHSSSWWLLDVRVCAMCMGVPTWPCMWCVFTHMFMCSVCLLHVPNHVQGWGGEGGTPSQRGDRAWRCTSPRLLTPMGAVGPGQAWGGAWPSGSKTKE